MHFTSSLLQLRMSEFAKKLSQTLLSLVLFFVVLLLPGNLFAQTPIASYPLNGNAIDVSRSGLNGPTLSDLSTIAYYYPALQIDGNGADLIKISGNFSYTSGSIILNARVKSFNHFKKIFDKSTSEFIHVGTENGKSDTTKVLFQDKNQTVTFAELSAAFIP
jgi:hypothetical protein